MAPPASAQSPLSLLEAIERAKAHNPDVRLAAAVEREAAERVTQARGAYFPKVDVAESWQNRPEIALAMQQEQLAAAAVDAAQAAFLPQIAAQGAWELNGGAWHSRSSAWVAGVVVRINLFHGLADKARLAEAREQARRRALEKDKAETMTRLDVQIAIARLEAARASEAVGRAAADRARESRRIIRDRYESGLTDVAMLLRSADAVEQADAQQIAARVNVLTATAALHRAIGRP